MEPITKTTPKDFFLWLGAIVALYGSVTGFLTLVFTYINYAFPDPLAYSGDPYGSGSHVAMATLIVLVPLTLVLFRIIRSTIVTEPGKAQIWVRRWALVLTLFVAGAAVAIDLITALTTFLGGEISERFILKVAVVLLVALGIFLHFLADLKGYWVAHSKKGNLVGVGVAVLVLATIIAGFFIIGTPSELRTLRYDAQKVSDLQNIQYQIIYYWQTKGELPATLAEVADPLSGSVIPVDPETGASYSYSVAGPLTFSLCSTFGAETPDTAGQGSYPGRDIAYTSWGPQPDENWKHPAGEHCYERTIDPERYAPLKAQ
ncbi:MAG TPA: DUF5671 domain-containing protein [Candidatus Paceibacterota bacterium]|nr:DUF5671 domain-containing protein [Candidatus Paceibacterota bacterium]